MKCLVRKLGCEINNSNLDVFGTLKLVISAGGVGNNTYKAPSGMTYTMSVDGDGDFVVVSGGSETSQGQSVEITSTSRWLKLNTTNGCNLTIYPRTNLAELKFSNGSLASPFNLSKIKDCIHITEISIPRWGSSPMCAEGNITDLGAFTSLTKIAIYGNDNVVGTVESFVAAQRANGRTTGSITIVNQFAQVTMLNSSTSTRTTINGGSSGTALTWDATTITFGDNTITA